MCQRGEFGHDVRDMSRWFSFLSQIDDLQSEYIRYFFGREWEFAKLVAKYFFDDVMRALCAFHLIVHCVVVDCRLRIIRISSPRRQ